MTYWKRFVAWVIASKDKIEQDPFLLTEWNVIILQVVFAFCILGLVALAFQYLYEDIVQTLLAGIMASIATGENASGEDILASVEDVKTQHFLVVFLSTVAITTLLGYFVARASRLFPPETLSLPKKDSSAM